MKNRNFRIVTVSLLIGIVQCSPPRNKIRQIKDFNQDWRFWLGDVAAADSAFDDSDWRQLDLPHDWSIEGEFSPDHPATPGGGALPGGFGWYRKSFQLPESVQGKCVFIEFDGIYRNSEVWINGQLLGKRPNGYISFRYKLSPYLKYGEAKNILAVRVDNSKQPNSRWYSGSGIYRNVRLVITDPVHVDHWGTYITTPVVQENGAEVKVHTRVKNETDSDQWILLKTSIRNTSENVVAMFVRDTLIPARTILSITDDMSISHPRLWSLEDPCLYQALTDIEYNGRVCDHYVTSFGIRTFRFDAQNGFFLNGRPVKIKGVCNHHDLGCLGAAVNTRALERQLEIMKAMGVNSLRTSHNPPAPELLDLCDRMGILVMDEVFDMWKKNKNPYDYAMVWDEWHERDLKDFIRRDRNHACVIIWSIGNEVLEQWDSTGVNLARELTNIVREMDPTRPITSGLNDPIPHNYVIQSGALDLIGFNYHHETFGSFPDMFPGQKFIGTETNSALATRGYYDMPSDSIRVWPERWDKPFDLGNPDHTCSSYDNCRTPWGSTHEATWEIVRKYDFLSGIYVWTGFDYLGEPTPYGWPSRSSYFGVVDLAGFPKDAYYFYQSEWTDHPVLHIFPHWNWAAGDTVDVWAYTNCDEIELFLNGESQGRQSKTDDRLYMTWRLAYQPGTIRGVGRTGEHETLVREIKTAGSPARIELSADRKMILADGRDLSFVTVRILDKNSNFCPLADNEVHFEIHGHGFLRAVDNGSQTDHVSFQAAERKAFNGLCLAVIQSEETPGRITLNASAEGLEGDTIMIQVK